ncbi:MAG: hypothetical protein ACRCUT_12415 [Spirochaetota bacterium]
MKSRIAVILFFLASMALIPGLFVCSWEKPESDPCMCFRNDSSSAITGLRFKETGSTEWVYSYFDSVQYSGYGFDCSEGTFDMDVDSGTYDFEMMASGGSTFRGWTAVPYDGENIGFLITNYTGTTVYGSVNDDCEQTGTAYYADY